jgi:P-type Ca2+ transporter type 2C
MAMGPLEVERSHLNVTQVFPFDSSRKCMATIVQLDSTKLRVYIKGASEVLLDRCKAIVKDPAKGLGPTDMTTETSQHLRQLITEYSSQSLRTISIVYRDFEHWPPAEADEADRIGVVIEDLLQDLVFLGIIGISDPLRDGARGAVQVCQNAGVVVRMVTGDNIATARAIAEKCGILASSDDVVMEGREFRALDEDQRDAAIPRLRVLARSNPEDKRALVVRLKEMGETVAVTGDGTNDVPALAAADIGFAMGISGTEVAREASSIVLMDDNFASIVRALMWGRTVNDAVKKFLQVSD